MKQIKKLLSKSSHWLVSGIAVLLAILIVAITAAEYIKLPSFIPTWQDIFGTFDIEPESQVDPATGDFELHVIDVGKADCLLIRCGGEDMLIDAGETYSGDLIISYLRNAGVTKLKYVMASHPHADHIGSMHEILKEFEVGEVILGDIPEKLTPTSKCYEKLLDTIEEKNLKVMKGEFGTTFTLGGAKAEILSPVPGFEDDELNNYSLVTRMVYGSNSFLLTGDAESEAEKAMLNQGLVRDCDVLKVGHHGSDSSTKKKFLQAATPEYGIISVGEENTYGHPDDKVLKRLDEYGVEYYRTDLNGTVIAYSDGKTVTVKTEK